jgi:hypothetical protein
VKPPSLWEKLLYFVVRNVIVGFCKLFWRVSVE